MINRNNPQPPFPSPRLLKRGIVFFAVLSLLISGCSKDILVQGTLLKNGIPVDFATTRTPYFGLEVAADVETLSDGVSMSYNSLDRKDVSSASYQCSVNLKYSPFAIKQSHTIQILAHGYTEFLDPISGFVIESNFMPCWEVWDGRSQTYKIDCGLFTTKEETISIDVDMSLERYGMSLVSNSAIPHPY